MPGLPQGRELVRNLPFGQGAAAQRRDYLFFLGGGFSKLHNLGGEKKRVVLVREVSAGPSVTVVHYIDATVWFYLIAKLVLGKIACPAEKEPEGFV
jgi:hypothetical protein